MRILITLALVVVVIVAVNNPAETKNAAVKVRTWVGSVVDRILPDGGAA